jgi:uncharacterized protein (DUF433 family)
MFASMATQLNDSFERYLLALRNTAANDQTEMTSRSALEALLNEAAREFAQGKVVVTHEPRRAQDKGAPDFKITSRGSILGYVENKAMGENLARVAMSDQIKKYLTLSPNLLLTDYLHWMWITPQGVQEVRLAEASALEGRTVRVQPARAHELQALLQGFYSQPPQQIGTAKALAEALATRSQLLRDFLGEELVRQDKAKQGGVLMGLYGAFKQQVSHEITLKEFADAFAQTLAYGLFLAKLNAKPTDTITLLNAKQFVPASVGLIQELVGFLDRLDQPSYADVRWVVEEVLSIINNLDLGAIHEDLAFRNRKARRGTDTRPEAERRLFSRDPFVYFYEDYLAKYDAKMRKSRGVYYTPPPIVNFIVRAINDILKDTFGIAEGVADRARVTVLDFATGTGTFLIEVLERIFDEIGGAGSAKAPLVVRDHILKNIYGFEYLIAPYTIAHLKLSQHLRDKEEEAERDAGELGPQEGERFQVFLTNTLEPIDPEPNYLLPELSHETEAAQEIKEKPILVITGNPPYSGHSRNNGPAATKSVEAYRRGYPELSKPGQGKWLQDDYVKFIRFAQEKMDEVEEGVVGIITNHSFLDNPTFKGMRASLIESFDQLYFIDLHGNAKKKERAPDGSADENVFDIEQGVAISILVKRPGLAKGVWRADWWGDRQSKYERAALERFAPAMFEPVEIAPPLFLFTQRDVAAEKDYSKLWSVATIFGRNGDPAPGIVTTHDEFAVSFSPIEAVAKVRQLLATKTEDEARELFRLCMQSQWSYERAKRELPELDVESAVTRIAYRPFDERFTIWNSNVAVHRRLRMTEHMRRPNVALITTRLTKDEPWPFAADTVPAHKLGSRYDISYSFPLYLYPEEDGQPPRQTALLAPVDPFAGRDRIENISPGFRRWIDARYGASPTPEQVFGYVYAVLHAPTYRSAYADFLRTDFPRVPFPETFDEFKTLAALGWALAEMHLMRREPRDAPRARYIGKGNNRVEKSRWSEKERTVWMNPTQGFAGVTPEVWAFTIGGYPVLEKYLKSRKERTLTLDEIEHVERVVAVLGSTIRQMELIDEAYLAAFPALDAGATAGDEDIHSDPDIMGGEPVFRGTRLPVRSVAEMLEAGADETEMLQGYPSLTRARMSLARRWAYENPPSLEPGRPANREFKIVDRKSVPRRPERGEDEASGKAQA